MLDIKIISLCLLGVSGATGENGLRNTHVESAVGETRTGLSYKFDRIGREQGSDQTCVDSEQRSFDYGERKLSDNDTADDCAHFCVHKQDARTLGHLVGFNFHFEDSLCQCLYKNSEGITSDFDSFIENNNGEDKVDGTEHNSGWQCYAGAGVTVTDGPLRLPSNDEEERVGNEIYDEMTVEVELEGSSNDGESSLCSSNADCPPTQSPELKWCARRNCEGVGTCQSRENDCPTDVEIQ